MLTVICGCTVDGFSFVFFCFVPCIFVEIHSFRFIRALYVPPPRAPHLLVCRKTASEYDTLYSLSRAAQYISRKKTKSSTQHTSNNFWVVTSSDGLSELRSTGRLLIAGRCHRLSCYPSSGIDDPLV